MAVSHRILIAALVLGSSAPVLAIDPMIETTTVRVYRPAVASPAAIHRLERHIAGAALEACGALPGSDAQVRAAVAQSRCWHDSYTAGIAQIDAADHGRVASLTLPRADGNP